MIPTEKIEKLTFKKLIMTIGNLPSSYVESLSYYECMLWLCNYLENTVIPAVNNNGEAVEELQTLFVELKTYVDNYLTDANLQPMIDNKLDEMAEDGTLADIVAQYVQLQGLLTYNSVEEMKKAENITVGSFLQTYGFYEYNDGGAAKYKARTITNEDVIDNMTLFALSNETLVAELIVDSPVNILQLGAKGDNETDNITYINKALSKYKNIYMPKGTYIISNSITLTDNYIFKCDGQLKMTQNLPAVIINGIKNIVTIFSIVSSGNGLEVLDTNKLTYGNEINVNFIEADNLGIYYYSTSNGIQYNNFNGSECIGTNGAIKLHVPSTGAWVNENRFYNVQVQCTTGSGVEILNEKTFSDGNRFIFIGFEGVYDAITLNNARFNSFISCRSNESISNNHVVFKNDCSSNRISKDVTVYGKIDTSQMTGGFDNTIDGVIFDNETNYRNITNHLIVTSNYLTYKPLRNNMINTFSSQETTIELNGMIYTYILCKDNATIKLGPGYCCPENVGNTIFINTGNPSTIVDANNKTIIASSDSAYQGYKNVKLTLAGIKATDGTCYWTKELVI